MALHLPLMPLSFPKLVDGSRYSVLALLWDGAAANRKLVTYLALSKGPKFLALELACNAHRVHLCPRSQIAALGGDPDLGGTAGGSSAGAVADGGGRGRGRRGGRQGRAAAKPEAKQRQRPPSRSAL
eukprot:8188466-Alexandrium_andersonii.AAC.1